MRISDWSSDVCSSDLGDRSGMERSGLGLDASAQTTAWLAERSATGTVVRGVLTFRDAPRTTAREAIDQLHALGLRTVMISGDRRAAAEAIATELGIDTVIADTLPEQKAQAVTADRKSTRLNSSH